MFASMVDMICYGEIRGMHLEGVLKEYIVWIYGEGCYQKWCIIIVIT